VRIQRAKENHKSLKRGENGLNVETGEQIGELDERDVYMQMGLRQGREKRERIKQASCKFVEGRKEGGKPCGWRKAKMQQEE